MTDIEIFLISSNSYLTYIFNQEESNFHITAIRSIDELYSKHSSYSLPIIICDDILCFNQLKISIYREKTIVITSDKNLKWKYKLITPLRICDLLSLITNLLYRKIYKINHNILFFYNQNEILYKNSIKIKLSEFETEILFELIMNNNSCTKSFLISKIWQNHNFDQVSKNFDNHMYKLRKKLEPFHLLIEMKDNYYIIQIISSSYRN